MLPFTLTCVCGHWIATVLCLNTILRLCVSWGGGCLLRKLFLSRFCWLVFFVCWQAAAVHLASSRQRLGLFHLQLQSGNHNFVSRTSFPSLVLTLHTDKISVNNFHSIEQHLSTWNSHRLQEGFLFFSPVLLGTGDGLS